MIRNDLENNFIETDKIEYKNSGKKWSPEEEEILLSLFNDRICVKDISEKLGRKVTAILSRLYVKLEGKYDQTIMDKIFKSEPGLERRLLYYKEKDIKKKSIKKNEYLQKKITKLKKTIHVLTNELVILQNIYNEIKS